MEGVMISSIRDQLIERRAKLKRYSASERYAENLYDLLVKVDKALERIDTGGYGICEICHDPIEADRLLVDPLLTVCLDHLNKDQQHALEVDLEDAGRIQRALLPKKNTRIDGWEFGYHYSPAGIVSGDFCDVMQGNDESVVFLVGDVSGKGIAASLMMTHLHALLHSLVSFNLPINEILQKANRLFCESTVNANYATLAAGKAFPDGTLELCIAGHNPPFIISSGSIVKTRSTGIPIGLFCDAEYEVAEFSLNKGDSIVLYTDGLTEASVNGEEYGEDRLIKLLSEMNDSGTDEIVNSIIREHKEYLKNKPQVDDITVAVLRRV